MLHIICTTEFELNVNLTFMCGNDTQCVLLADKQIQTASWPLAIQHRRLQF